MSVEEGAKVLLQMILKERCIREKEAFNILKKFGDSNEVLQKVTANIQLLGLSIDHELLNGEEYLVLNNQRIMLNKKQLFEDTEKNEHAKEGNLCISRFNLVEGGLYISILDHVINKEKYVDYSTNNNEYKKICLKMQITKQDVCEKILKKLELFKWIKLDNKNQKVLLGERFYTDLKRYFSLSHLTACSLCNTALIVDKIRCTECLSPYHEHCFNTLSKRLHVCYVCQKIMDDQNT